MDPRLREDDNAKGDARLRGHDKVKATPSPYADHDYVSAKKHKRRMPRQDACILAWLSRSADAEGVNH